MDPTTLQKLLTPNEVKAALCLRSATNHTLRNMERRGQLRPIRLGSRTLRYDAADVARLIEQARGGGAK